MRGRPCSLRRKRTAGSSGGRTSSRGPSWYQTPTRSWPGWSSTGRRVARESATRSCPPPRPGPRDAVTPRCACAPTSSASRPGRSTRGVATPSANRSTCTRRSSSERQKPAVTPGETAGMRAMVLDAPGRPLRAAEIQRPRPGPGQVLLRVSACAVCRTDLHVVDGELPRPKLPLVPGHEIVGSVAAAGPGAARFQTGDRVGLPWLGGACGVCAWCRSARENLCDRARFTGYDIDGGYAEYTLADERFCFPIPEGYPDLQAA